MKPLNETKKKKIYHSNVNLFYELGHSIDIIQILSYTISSFEMLIESVLAHTLIVCNVHVCMKKRYFRSGMYTRKIK